MNEAPLPLVNAQARKIAELEGLLDHYRGTCDHCGREDVLLHNELEGYYSDTYMSSQCWQDIEECERLHEEREKATRKANQAAAALAHRERKKRVKDGTANYADMMIEVYEPLWAKIRDMPPAMEKLVNLPGIVDMEAPTFIRFNTVTAIKPGEDALQKILEEHTPVYFKEQE